jgi:SPP1 family predicted phage head-tail adaptor
MTSAQDLDRSITIERSQDVANAFNELIPTWLPVLKVRAKRRDISDGEKDAAGQIGATLMTRFVVRSSSNTRVVLPTDRISHDGLIWNIKGIKQADEGRNRFLEITAIASVNHGETDGQD